MPGGIFNVERRANVALDFCKVVEYEPVGCLVTSLVSSNPSIPIVSLDGYLLSSYSKWNTYSLSGEVNRCW
jgi:hypothetical protein